MDSEEYIMFQGEASQLPDDPPWLQNGPQQKQIEYRSPWMSHHCSRLSPYVPDWASAGPVWAATGSDWASTGPDWASASQVWAATGPDWASAGPDWASTGPDWAPTSGLSLRGSGLSSHGPGLSLHGTNLRPWLHMSLHGPLLESEPTRHQLRDNDAETGRSVIRYFSPFKQKLLRAIWCISTN
jgi:hypothetical protein